MSKPARTLGIWPLALINIIAIDNLRALTYGAEVGLGLVTYYVIATLFFFVPVALISTVFATYFPEKGGIYVWVSRTVGKRAGLVVIWIQWLYNIVWYPTQLTFVASTFISLFTPLNAQKPHLLIPLMLIMFWVFTLINSLGMRASSIISAIGAVLGTLLPIVLLIICGLVFYNTPPYEYAMTVSWQALIPSFNPGSMSYLTGMLFGLIGIEIGAYHADEVINPRRTFPRAILLSGSIIFASMVLASLAIALIVPTKDLDIVTGILQAFTMVATHPALQALSPVIVLLVVIGGASTVATWIIGPSKGLMVAAQEGLAPALFKKTNSHGAPVGVLLVQALIFTCLTCLYVLLPVRVIYMLLSAITTQLALIVYIIMFIGFITHYKTMKNSTCYRIPGGKLMAMCVSLSGLIISVLGVLVGFFMPDNIADFSHSTYSVYVLLGSLACLFPTLFYVRKNG